MKGLVSVTCLLLVSAYSAKLPDYFKKCKKGSEGAQCVVENGFTAVRTLTKDGEPQFNLQSLTPIHVAKINLQATPHLKIVLEDIEFTGFEGMQFKDGKIDDNELRFNGHINRAGLVAKYDMNGRILILPIRGKGNCNITMVDFDYDYKAKLFIEERKGRKYYKVETNENTVGGINNVKLVHWQFDNLFNGDARLGIAMNRFLNDNWKEVFGEVKRSVEQASAYSIINYFVNGYLHKIPIIDLFEG